MGISLTTQLFAVTYSTHHSKKALLVLIYVLLAAVLALVVYAIAKSKQAKAKDKRFIVKLGRTFDPAKPMSGALLFILLFAIIGGGYQAYRSYAATCLDFTYQYGSSGVCVGYIQKMTNYIWDSERLVWGGTDYSLAKISVDGDFGPATKAAVIASQKFEVYQAVGAYSGSANGIVNGAGWNQLCYAVYWIQSNWHLTTQDSTLAAGLSAAQHAGCWS